MKSWPIELDQFRVLIETFDAEVEIALDQVNIKYVVEMPLVSDVFNTIVLFKPIVSLGFGESEILGG